MGNLLTKIKAFIRLNEIQDKQAEREYFEDMLFDAWKHRGNMTYDNRIESIKRVLDRIKEDSLHEVTKRKEMLLESEKTNDKASHIFWML